MSALRRVCLGGALCLASALAQAAEPLSAADAAAWLQKVANAARNTSYEGVFVFQQGGAGASQQTLQIAGKPTGHDTQTRLVSMDGEQREVRCSQRASFTLMFNGAQLQMEKRLNNRHFPDLLPAQAAPLANWYTVRAGVPDRVAGRECDNFELTPKDRFRWGYVLCVDKGTAFPLRAVMVNGEGQPLVQYRFTDIRLGASPRIDSKPIPAIPDAARPVQNEKIGMAALPPGYARIAAMRRQLPNRPGEVEHWVFSDGLTHVSLFLEQASRPVEPLRGESKQGMTHMIKRQVGAWQATVLGDAPWPAVEAISTALEARP